MSDPSKQFAVLWEASDWKRITDAVDTLNAREHMDLTPTDIIRSGTRRFVDEILSQQPTQKAS